MVTISLVASRTTDEEIEAAQIPDLTENEVAVLKALLPNNTLRRKRSQQGYQYCSG